MSEDKVRWFNKSTKALGLLRKTMVGRFSSIYSAMQVPGFKTLSEGQSVRFDVVQG